MLCTFRGGYLPAHYFYRLDMDKSIYGIVKCANGFIYPKWKDICLHSANEGAV